MSPGHEKGAPTGASPANINRPDAITEEQAAALNVARLLAANGIPVFCAYPDASKTTGYALPKGWEHTKADPRYVDAWRPGMALCAVMGQGLDLVDCDPRNGGQRQLLTAAMPTTYLEQDSPSDGSHYFVASLGLRSRDNFAPGWDFKAGDEDGEGRGFAFLAPTERVSKTSGDVRPYRIVKAPTEDELERLPSDTSGHKLKAIIEAARASKVGTRAEIADGEKVTEGGRNAYLTSLAGSMRRVGMTEEAMYAGLAAMNESHCDPPLEDDELRTVAHSVARYEPAEHDPGPLRSPETGPIGPLAASYSLINWPEFWQKDHREEDFAIAPVFPRGRSIAIYSPAKGGKSLLLLWMMAAAATGTPILDYTGDALSIVYLDFEMTEGDIYERLQDLGYGPESDLSGLHYYLLPSLPPLDTPEGGQVLRQIASEHDADIVVIDTTSRVISGEENSADTLRAYYQHTGQLLKADGRTVVRADHAGKNLDAGQRGTSAKNDDVDLVWELSARENGVRLRATHRRQSWVPEFVELRQLQDPLRYESTEYSKPPGTDEVIRRLDALGVPNETGRKRVRALMEEHGITGRNEAVSAAIRIRKARLVAGTPSGTPPLPLDGTPSGDTLRFRLGDTPRDTLGHLDGQVSRVPPSLDGDTDLGSSVTCPICWSDLNPTRRPMVCLKCGWRAA